MRNAIHATEEKYSRAGSIGCVTLTHVIVILSQAAAISNVSMNFGGCLQFGSGLYPFPNVNAVSMRVPNAACNRKVFQRDTGPELRMRKGGNNERGKR